VRWPSTVAAAAAVALLLVGGLVLLSRPGARSAPNACAVASDAVAPTSTPIRHVFFLIKENHAFENYFATLPNVTGHPPNGTFAPTYGQAPNATPFPLDAASTPELPHDRASDVADWDGGRNDNFVAQAAAAGAAAPRDAIGFYARAQIPTYFAMAANGTLADHFFTGVMGPTLPNRLFDLAATTGGWTSDAPPPASAMMFPTILDQLSNARIPWAYDYLGPTGNLTPLYLPAVTNSPCERAQVQPVANLSAQLNAPDPPAVTFVDPAPNATYSEHPPQNVTAGAEWSATITNTIFASPVGPSSVVFLFFDENGGFWDPVSPPVFGPLGDGFRVPFVAMSPWSPPGTVDSATFDPAALLHFVDANWGLPYLNARVASAELPAGLFDFSSAPRPFPPLATPISLAVATGTASPPAVASGHRTVSALSRGPGVAAIAAVARLPETVRVRGPTLSTGRSGVLTYDAVGRSARISVMRK
jgi:phospholipase C